MLEGLLDRDNRHGSRLLAANQEAPLQCRIGADPRPAVDAISLIRARHEEDQRHARILDQIFEFVDPVVAGPVRDHQRLAVVRHLYKTGRIAFG